MSWNDGVAIPRGSRRETPAEFMARQRQAIDRARTPTPGGIYDENLEDRAASVDPAVAWAAAGAPTETARLLLLEVSAPSLPSLHAPVLTPSPLSCPRHSTTCPFSACVLFLPLSPPPSPLSNTHHRPPLPAVASVILLAPGDACLTVLPSVVHGWKVRSSLRPLHTSATAHIPLCLLFVSGPALAHVFSSGIARTSNHLPP